MLRPGPAPAAVSAPTAIGPHLPSIALRALAALRRWHERANATFRLRELDDRLLRDVGLRRCDIETPPPLQKRRKTV